MTQPTIGWLKEVEHFYNMKLWSNSSSTNGINIKHRKYRGIFRDKITEAGGGGKRKKKNVLPSITEKEKERMVKPLYISLNVHVFMHLNHLIWGIVVERQAPHHFYSLFLAIL